MDAREALRRLSGRVPNRGVVVIESNNGHCNVGCDGDGYEIMNAFAHGMGAFARNTGVEFSDVISACNEIRAIGFEKFLELYREGGKKPVMYQGVEIGEYDPPKEKAAEERLKALESQVKTLQSEKAKLENDLKWRDSTIASLKDSIVETQKAHDKHVKELQKELKAEQHKALAPTLKDIKRMCEQYTTKCDGCPLNGDSGCMVLHTPEEWSIE